MRIAFTGGGTGGHFYPLIATAEAIEDACNERALVEPELYYLGPKPFDSLALAEHDIIHKPSPAAQSGFLNAITNILGIIRSVLQLYNLYPDVILSTGGWAAFPTLYAAKLLHIPVIIYDADATPGKVSLWSSSFAQWIAVAHADAAPRFPNKVQTKIANIGHPIRKEIEGFAREGGHEFLHIDPNVPTIFIMGGSQGAQTINNTVLDTLPDLVTRYNIVHQAGKANLDEVRGISGVVLKDSPHKERYRVFGLLNTLAIRMAAGTASVVIARAGSGTIFEVASWGIPAILVPIPLDVSHDQTDNAFSYARAGGAIVIEQQNLTPHVLSAEIDRLINDPELRNKMSESAKKFARPDAAKKLATIILETAVAHEPV